MCGYATQANRKVQRKCISQPKLQLNFQAVPSFGAVIALVQADRAAFAISSLVHNVSADLTFRPFAYDGLAVFVPFSYARRDNSLPTALGGQISAQGGDTGVTALPTFETLRQVIRDFEERNVGAVSFASISRVFGQCSVYPLAIKEENNPAVPPLITIDRKAVTPNTDLCNEKGNYTPDYEAFITGRYPLDNRRPPVGDRFAAMMTTAEAQKLLQRTGLIPLQVPSSQ